MGQQPLNVSCVKVQHLSMEFNHHEVVIEQKLQLRTIEINSFRWKYGPPSRQDYCFPHKIKNMEILQHHSKALTHGKVWTVASNGSS